MAKYDQDIAKKGETPLALKLGEYVGRGNQFTQESFAEKLGVSRQLVSKWMNGTAKPSADMMEKIAKLLNVSVAYLEGKTEISIATGADLISLLKHLEGIMVASGPDLHRDKCPNGLLLIPENYDEIIPRSVSFTFTTHDHVIVDYYDFLQKIPGLRANGLPEERIEEMRLFFLDKAAQRPAPLSHYVWHDEGDDQDLDEVKAWSREDVEACVESSIRSTLQT